MSYFHPSSDYLARFEAGIQESGDEYVCTALQWSKGLQAIHSYKIRVAGEIHAIQDAPLTILIAPLDEANKERLAGFRALVSRFKIPGTFIDERSQHVLSSFGHMQESEGSSCNWLHFLLKEIELDDGVAHEVEDNRTPLLQRLGHFLGFLPPRRRHQLRNQTTEKPRRHIPLKQLKENQRSANWSKCAFFLRAQQVGESSRPRCQHVPCSPPEQNITDRENGGLQCLCGNTLKSDQEKEQSQTSESNCWGSGRDRMPRYNITLICFGAPGHIVDWLESIPDTLDIRGVVQHPFILWEVILYYLSIFLDMEVFKLAEAFRTAQHDLGYLTAKPSKFLKDIDFSELHLLADHMILILEGARGLLASIDGLVGYHEARLRENPYFLARKTHDALTYRRRFVQATTERGITFEKRINNMISLFFNQVSLQDTGLMMRDSSSLTSIALITLVFLPITTVATVCGSEFFSTFENDEGSKYVRMDPSAWKMFLVSGIATVALVSVWLLQLNKLEKQYSRGRETQPRRVVNLPVGV